jgi:hypothetical protein
MKIVIIFISDTTDLLVKDSMHLQVLEDIDSVALWTYTFLDDYGSKCFDAFEAIGDEGSFLYISCFHNILKS